MTLLPLELRRRWCNSDQKRSGGGWKLAFQAHLTLLAGERSNSSPSFGSGYRPLENQFNIHIIPCNMRRVKRKKSALPHGTSWLKRQMIQWKAGTDWKSLLSPYRKDFQSSSLIFTTVARAMRGSANDNLLVAGYCYCNHSRLSNSNWLWIIRYFLGGNVCTNIKQAGATTERKLATNHSGEERCAVAEKMPVCDDDRSKAHMDRRFQ